MSNLRDASLFYTGQGYLGLARPGSGILHETMYAF
jgi:hypothetical protein